MKLFFVGKVLKYPFTACSSPCIYFVCTKFDILNRDGFLCESFGGGFGVITENIHALKH